MRRIVLSSALALATLACVAVAQTPDAAQRLLDSAQLWETQHRPDLARLALEKLLRAHPGHPQASLRLGELEVRSGRIEDAERVLGELQARHPDHPAALELAAILRVQTRDRLQLATLRRLYETERYAEAAAAARRLFPQGPPPGGYGLEYWRILAQEPGGTDAARAGLEDFARRYPQDSRYRIALAELLVRDPATRTLGLRQLADLAAQAGPDRNSVLAAWRRGLAYLSDAPSSLPHLREFLKAAPDDIEVMRRVAALHQRQREQQRRMQDPVYRELAAAERERDAGQLAAAETRIAGALQQRPQDGTALAALAQLRMRQNRHAEAEDLYERAATHDRANARQWRQERDRARMWIALDDAAGLRERGQLDAAQARIDYALRLRPGDTDALAMQASLLARQPDGAAAAERLYRQLLLRDPTQRAAGRGLLRLLQAQQRSDDAESMLAELARRAPAQQSALDGLRAEWLQQRAASARAAGRDGEALRWLEAAQASQPADPWLRYDLAREYARLRLPDEARALMDAAPAVAPDNDDARYAQALLLASLDEDTAALAALEFVPEARRSDGMRNLDQRLRLGLARETALAAFEAGRRDEAVARLDAALALAGDDPDRLASLASSWIDVGEAERGLALLRPLASASADPVVKMRWAQLLNQAERDPELAPLLADLDALPLAADAHEQWLRLQAQQALRIARQQADEGNAAAALRTLEPALQRQPDAVDLLAARAQHHLALGRTAAARRDLEQALQRRPDDTALRLAYARWLIAAEARAEALRELDTLQAQSKPTDTELRGDLVIARLELDDRAGARRLAAAMQAEAPDSVAARIAAARVARAGHRHNAAMDLYRAARADELAAGTRGYSAAQAGIEALEARRNGTIVSGPSLYAKDGSPGISEYTARQLPIELRLPYRYESEFFAVADVVDADAGRLPAVFDEAALYGSVQAQGPASLDNFADGAAQNARGVDLGLGWQSDRLRLDLGTTPIGFLVENWVGGLRWSDRAGAFDYSLNLARRPVTGSLLSYAGARDPATGRIWGGVVASGAEGRLGWDRGRLGSSFSAGAYRLTGRNVLDNEQLTLRLAADWDLIRRGDRRLEAGLTLSAWRYAEALGEYSFGHGGYYSPQRYLSLALPVEWSGRRQRLSWQLRGAVSVSRTRTDAQGFYPNDPALQALALGMPLPPGYEAPVYAAESGGGSGVSLRGALEYRIATHWTLGGSFELDRSEFYTPNFFSSYLRYDFDGKPLRVDYPPRPPRPYASY